MKDFETVIGLEVHVELATKSKMFCTCSTQFAAKPNTQCCPVCMALPGTLPVINQKAVEYAVKAGIALECEIQNYSAFDRKNYFYPDLPKSYQITQFYKPFAKNGYVDVEDKRIGIHEIHMEEDAGKLVHLNGQNKTFVDYNRCGVPLIEIVTEPDIRSAEQAVKFLEKIKSMFEYLGISDCKMQEGSMRADVNLSVRRRGDPLGVRTEIKNLNSFKAVEKAIAYEQQRQIDLILSGQKVIQQTLRYDEQSAKTYAMRAKENANDYRYFPEPDLPPLYISDETVSKFRDEQPQFAHQKAEVYENKYAFSQRDSRLLASSKYIATLFEDTVNVGCDAKEAKNWIMTDVMRYMNLNSIEPQNLKLNPEKLAYIINLTSQGKINRQSGKLLLENVIDSDIEIDYYIKENGLMIDNSADLIESSVREVLQKNPETVKQYKNGQTKVVGFFVGQVMKLLEGKADAAAINKELNEQLSEMLKEI